MNKKQIAGVVLSLIVAAGAAGTGGFLIGRNSAESTYRSEHELNIRLNRSDLDGMRD